MAHIAIIPSLYEGLTETFACFPQLTHQIPLERLINRVLITARTDTSVPAAERRELPVGFLCVLFVPVNCIVFHYQSSTSSFTQRRTGRGELMSKPSWGRLGQKANSDESLVCSPPLGFEIPKVCFTCHGEVQTLRGLAVSGWDEIRARASHHTAEHETLSAC